MIKILVISTTGLARKEGISTVMFDNFSRFDKHKFNLHFIVSGSYSRELAQKFEAIGITMKYLPSRRTDILQYMKALIRLFEKEKYDALYIHGSSAIMSIELMIAKICGCNVRVVHSHNTACNHKIADRLLRPLFHTLYTDALACGKNAGQWLYGDREFRIVKNGRDINKYCFKKEKRIAMRKALGVSDDTLVVGHVGVFNKQKNQQFILRVFERLRTIYPKAKLYLIGEGSLLDETKMLAKRLCISDDVMFTGSIGNVDEMLQAMDVMILPSRHEGLPLVVIEWQIAALPCLLSDSVTGECSYSDLVHYMSLDESEIAWAKKLIEISRIDRNSVSCAMVEMAQNSGYDIDQNAIQLQNFFIEKCRGHSNSS